jgi:hypothetical protein
MKKNTLKLFFLLLFSIAFGNTAIAQCVAGFTSNVNSVNGQYGTGLVSFTDTSQASVGDTLISWAWDFGDGATANIKNPVHFYPTAGNYTVTLLVNDNSSNNTVSKQILMNVPYPHGCDANINYTYNYPLPTSGTVPTLFLSNANIIPTNDSLASVKWTFGDGNSSTLLNPVYTYQQDTVFVLRYRITTVNGCIDSTEVYIQGIPCQMYVTVAPNPTDSTKFDATVVNGAPPYTTYWYESTSQWIYTPTPASQISNGGLTLQAVDSTMYTLTINQSNGCSATYGYVSLNGFSIQYNNSPCINANFVFLQQGGNSLTVDFSDNTIDCYSIPLNLVSQFWDFGDVTGTKTWPLGVTTWHCRGMDGVPRAACELEAVLMITSCS